MILTSILIIISAVIIIRKKWVGWRGKDIFFPATLGVGERRIKLANLVLMHYPEPAQQRIEHDRID